MKFFVRARGSADLLLEFGKMLGWQPSELADADVVLTDDMEQVGIAVAAGKSGLLVTNLAAGGAQNSVCNRVVTFGSGCLYGVVRG